MTLWDEAAIVALAQKLRAGSEWSSHCPWEELPEDRKQRWLRFAKMTQEIIHDAVIDERMEVRKAWREAMKQSPIPLNVTIPDRPPVHTKSLLRIFAAFKCATDK